MGGRGGAGEGGAKERNRELELVRKSDGVMKRFGDVKRRVTKEMEKTGRKIRTEKEANKLLDQEVE